jgi:hypothetical protein
MSAQTSSRRQPLEDGERGGVLSEDHEFMAVLRKFPPVEVMRIEEAYYEMWWAFYRKPRRKTGEWAFEHSRGTAMLVAAIMDAAGYYRSMPVRAALRHDSLEDVEATTPYSDRHHAYVRMWKRYGMLETRVLLFVSRGQTVEQTEEAHLEQLLAGRDLAFLQLRSLRSVEDQLINWLSRTVKATGWLVRWTLGQNPRRRYPMNRDAWAVFVARVVKLCDRVNNLGTYTHPLVYGAKPDRLEYKLDITTQYYFPMLDQVLRDAPEAFREPLQELLAKPLRELTAAGYAHLKTLQQG